MMSFGSIPSGTDAASHASGCQPSGGSRLLDYDQIEQRYNSTRNLYEDQWVTKSRVDTIAQWKDETPFDLAEGEVRRIPFVLVFPVVEHPYGTADNLSLWDFLPASWNLGSGFRNMRISYRIDGDADVDGAAFDKGESTPITLT